MLLVLLPVFAGLPNSSDLFAICSLVVLVSVVLHGGSPMLLARIARKQAFKNKVAADDDIARPFGPAPATPDASAQIAQDESRTEAESPRVGSQRITIEELRRLWEANEPVTVLDVRTERSLEDSDLKAKGSIRIPPDHVVDRVRELGLGKEAWLVAYCT